MDRTDQAWRGGRWQAQGAWLYDTHVHLSDPGYAPHLDQVLLGMARMRVRAICVAMDGADSRAAAALAARSGGLVSAFAGVHPEMAGRDDGGAVVSMVESDPAAVSGIGEIGLDPAYHGSGADAAAQDRVFARMLALAERHGKPVSVHSRKSLGAVLDALGSYSLAGACLHWFDGGKKELRRAMDMGVYVGYGPLSVYAPDKRSLLARTDADRMLFETDGPVAFGGCFGRRPAQPCFVQSVAFAAADARGVSYGEACRIEAENVRRFCPAAVAPPSSHPPPPPPARTAGGGGAAAAKGPPDAAGGDGAGGEKGEEA